MTALQRFKRIASQASEIFALTLYYGAWAACFAILAGIGWLFLTIGQRPVIDSPQTYVVCQRAGEVERTVMSGRLVILEGSGWYADGQRFSPAYDESCWTRRGQ